MSLRSVVRPFLPNGVVRFLKKAQPRNLAHAQASRVLERLLKDNPVQLALHDPSLGVMKVPQSAGELLIALRRGMVGDATAWLGRVEPFVPRHGVIVDIGAYRGITTQWFAMRAARVYAFEPMPENARSIRQVLALRQIDNVTLVEQAVSDRIGQSSFNICEIKGHNSLGSVRTSRIIDRITVETTTLDRFAADNAIGRIDFLKIDVEGFEQEVLAGATTLLRERRIGGLIFEVSPSVLRDLGKSAGAVYDLLRDHGYAVRDLDGRTVGRAEVEASGFTDYLASPEPTSASGGGLAASVSGHG